MKDQLECTNCEAHFEGNFCPACGQKRFYRRQFDLRVAAGELAGEVLDIESGLGKTVRTLVFSPGKLTVDYLEGRQKSYVGPIKLYLLIITVNFLVYAYLDDYSLVNIEFLDRIRSVVPILRDNISVDLVKDSIRSGVHYHEINARINEILPLLLYLLIFMHALVLKVQFRSAGRYYIEHLVFSLHFMAFGFLRDIAVLPIQMISPEAGMMMTIATTIVYLFFALRRCYHKTNAQAVVHTAVNYCIFFLLFFLTVLTSIVLATVS